VRNGPGTSSPSSAHSTLPLPNPLIAGKGEVGAEDAAAMTNAAAAGACAVASEEAEA